MGSIPTPATKERNNMTLQTAISSDAYKALEQAGYPWPCNGAYNFLVKNYPNDYLALINSDALDPEALSACLQCGRYFQDDEVAKDQLSKFLNHYSDAVRIGALYGLLHHYEEQEREVWFKSLLNNSSQVLRKEVSSILRQEL